MADNRFDAEASGFGFMLAAFGAGALAGAIVGGSVGRVRELGWVTLGCLARPSGSASALMGVAPSVLGSCSSRPLVGVGIGFVNVRIVAWLQARTPEAMIGRVMSLAMMGGVIMSPTLAGPGRRPGRPRGRDTHVRRAPARSSS